MNEISFKGEYIRLTLQTLLLRGEKRSRGWWREDHMGSGRSVGRSGSQHAGREYV